MKPSLRARLAFVVVAALGAGVASAATGQQLFAQCVACHGAKGEGNPAVGAPAIAGQHVAYLQRQLRNFRAGVRGTRPGDTQGAQMRGIAATLPNEHLYDVYRRFGFGQPSGSGFPGEAGGVLPALKAWGPVEKATMSYGYGLNVTPLQLVQAYAALANGGRLRAPSFVKGAQNPDSAVVDPQIAATLVQMLETVVQPKGTAFPQAAVLNYRVAGKTGTSKKAMGGGYGKQYVSLFAGLVPASAPRLAAVVVVNDPQGPYYGGLVAAPAFGRVMAGALRLLDVAPDNARRWYAGGPDSGNVVEAPAADYGGDATYEEAVPQ